MNTTLPASEEDNFAKWFQKALTSTDKITKHLIGTIVKAVGGKVSVSLAQARDAFEGNVILDIERDASAGGFLVFRAGSRPRCEKCGRWERHD